MIKSILLDCDGTVWDRKTGEFFPVAKARLQALPKYVRVAFCTNQTSVGRRYWMKRGGFGDPTRLKGERAIRGMYDKLVREDLGLSDAPIYMAFRCRGKSGWSPAEKDTPEWDPEWVKPNPGMLKQAMKDLGLQASECVYIGDDTDEDQPDSGAARGANVVFHRAPQVWEDEAFWKGFAYKQQTLIDVPVLKEKDLSAFMERGKLSHAEIMANLNRIAETPFVPVVSWTYRGREWAQQQAREALANAVVASVQPVSKKKGRRK
jgi:hypothetical protein